MSAWLLAADSLPGCARQLLRWPTETVNRLSPGVGWGRWPNAVLFTRAALVSFVLAGSLARRSDDALADLIDACRKNRWAADALTGDKPTLWATCHRIAVVVNGRDWIDDEDGPPLHRKAVMALVGMTT